MPESGKINLQTFGIEVALAEANQPYRISKVGFEFQLSNFYTSNVLCWRKSKGY